MIAQTLIHIALATSSGLPGAVPDVAGEPAPKLVVLIVVDQLPAHVLPRLESHFVRGGFRRFLDEGAWYQQAYYPQAATLTGVGHATISTGGLPAGHGIAGNEWFDRERDRPVYCVEDTGHRWIGGKGRENDGTSPLNLTSTTFSDEARLARGGDSRAVAVSLKDRGSILLAGKLGKAFWYDSDTGLFVSSTHYFPGGALPDWCRAFNDSRPSDRFWRQTWNLLLDPADYRAPEDDRPYEIDVKGLGRTFPHVLGHGLARPGGDYYRALATAPQGNQITLDLALAAVEGEQLGSRGVTDMLLISLTANDYCGHVFGPESLEYLDITLQTDRQLARFFADLDARIGPGEILIVLTSDHGAAPSPEHVVEQGIPVSRIDPERIAREADAALDEAFGPDDWAGPFLNPGLFLRSEPVRSRGLDSGEVERVAAEAVRAIPGVAETFTRSQLATGRAPAGPLGRAAAATFHPERSPDVVIVQRPFWYLYKEMMKNAGMHGSPYPYDTHVPVLLYGPGIEPGRYSRRVSPADIAPTICHLLGITAPSACEGQVLHESLQAPAPEP